MFTYLWQPVHRKDFLRFFSSLRLAYVFSVHREFFNGIYERYPNKGVYCVAYRSTV